MNLGNTFPGLKQDKNGLNQGFMTIIFEINIKKLAKIASFLKHVSHFGTNRALIL
ncbi:hypothetical protein V4331_01460 [Lactococcus formosensis subsp. formosensis]|uniref:hypothetical protein n=1 Tax=Lactococcus formosensis TaxID=1281486 RepID=UPI0007CB9BD9|nr:hypothetical protein [Lactococcus formosensis]BAV02421.1 hypothetical protein NALG_0907 [Lactococcus formosensis]BDW48643.1 hypothetical protein LG21E20_03050 [Lactococcus formosensis]BDX24228.1 hypothetical protein LFMS200408A_03050 [Lactococcus formosensis]